MKKYIIIPFVTLLFFSCGKNDAEKASSILDEARNALSNNLYSEARLLIDSLRSTYPLETDVRREALAFADSVELFEAMHDLQVADSVFTFVEFELEDLKKKFVLEKQERYQTTGYYVTQNYAGSKSSFSFFPEVEETGALLAVEISRTNGIKYNFTPVEVDLDSNTIPACPISRPLTSDEQLAYDNCYALAKCFEQYKQAQQAREKSSLKVRFYEKKLSDE